MIVWLFYETRSAMSLRAFSFDEVLAARYSLRHPTYICKEKSMPEHEVGPFMYLHGAIQIHQDYIADGTNTYTISLDAKESDLLSHACDVIATTIKSFEKEVAKLPILGTYKTALNHLINEKYEFNSYAIEEAIESGEINEILDLS